MTESAARRHILYLCFEFPPISGPAVWRALGFTKYLSENGYDVTLLCSDRSIGWSDKYDGSLLEEIPPEIRIRRIPSLLLNDILAPMDYLIRATKNRLMLKVLRGVRWRVYGYYPEPHLLWAVKATFYGLYVGLLKKVDCIITSGPPHISHIAGYVVSRFTRSRWIIDYRDLWTDEPFISPQAGYQAKLFQAVERRLLKSADAVTTVSPFLVSYLKGKSTDPKYQAKFHTLRNGYDHVTVRKAMDKVKARPENKQLHIHFNGTITGGSQSYSFLDALKLLMSTNIDRDSIPVFTFTGMMEDLRKEISRRGLECHVLDVGFMSRLQSIEYSLGCDVLLVMVNNKSPITRGTIPAKTYEAMALGRHILAILPGQSDVKELLEEYGNATSCDVDDPEDICKALVKLIRLHHNGKLYVKPDAGRRRLILDKYSREAQTHKLISVIETVIKSGHFRGRG